MPGEKYLISCFLHGWKGARFAFDLVCWQVTLRSHPAKGEALKSEMKYASRMCHGSGVAPPAASHRRFCCVLSVLLQGHICECLLARVWGCWYKTWSTFKGVVHSKMKTLTLFTRSRPTRCYLVLWDATGGFFLRKFMPFFYIQQQFIMTMTVKLQKTP